MTATTVDALARTETSARTGLDRLAGAGGLLFVALLIVQNVVRASAPGFSASPAAVSTYFLDHRAAAIVPLGLFPLGMVGIVCFVSGVWTKAHDEESRWWANAGALAAATIAALFAMVNIIEIALVAEAHQLTGSPAVVQALWAVHAGAFGLDLAAIAVALVGLSRAARSTGLIPDWTAMIALPGAACLLIAAVFTVALTEGAPWIALGLVGFVVWGVFVVVASASLLRGGGLR